MMITNPVVSSVGNSTAIYRLPEPLRSQVTVLYTAFWKVWDSRTSPFEFGVLGAIFFPFFQIVILRCVPQDLQMTSFLILGIAYGHCARALYLEYRLMYREGREEFARLLRELPDANQALKTLGKIEPWRMTLLRHVILPRTAHKPIAYPFLFF